LKKYDFSIGGASKKNLVFSSEPTSYIYDGISIMSKITVKFNELAYAGITVKDRGINNLAVYDQDIHLYNYSDMDSIRISSNPFIPVVTSMKIYPSINCEDDATTCSLDGTIDPTASYLVYKITATTSNSIEKNGILFSYLQHLGIPLYQSSFDLYTLWTMMMCYEEFYDSVMKTEELKQIWEEMWVPEEYNDVDSQLKNIHRDRRTSISKGTSRLELIRFLAQFRLRCDGTILAWSRIKRLI